MAESLKSAVLTNWDSVTAGGTGANAGNVQPTSGLGAQQWPRQVTDYITVLAGTVNSFYRLCRFPTTAIIKHLQFITDYAIDTGSANTLVIDFNVAFSDSTDDGTAPSNQTALPTTANTGAVTLPATYSSPNKLFGTWTQSSASAAVNTDLTYNGTGANYDLVTGSNTPLWQLFGFSVCPGGMFDILMKVTTGVNTLNTTAPSVMIRLDFNV